MSQYCRITGKSRGLPKPNYFPLLPPISPADAQKLCRITGKSIGLPPTHSFIPVPLQPQRKKPNCPVTGKSIGQPQHHFIPGVPKAVPHEPIPGYRYVVPVLDNPPALLQELLKNDSLPDTIVAQYVYTLEEKKCGIVLPAALEAAVRQGTVSDLLLQDTNERFSLRLPEGRQVTVKVVPLQPKPPTEAAAAKEGSSPTTTTDGVTPILEGQGPNNPPPPTLESLKLPGLKPKKQFASETPASKAATKVTPPEVISKVEEQVVSADATSVKESDDLAPSAPGVPPLQPVSVEKKASEAVKPDAKMQEKAQVNGMQELIADIKEEISKLEVLETEKLDKLRGKETAKTAVKKQESKIEPPKETVIELKSQEEKKAAPVVASDVKETPVNTDAKNEEVKKPEIAKEEVNKEETAVSPPAPSPKKKIIKKKISSEEKAITAQNDAKLPSQVEATRKSDANETAEEPKPVRRESSSRALDTSVLKSVWDVAKRDEKSEKSGLTLKFVVGKQPTLKDIVALQKNMEKGEVIELVWDQEVLQGKNIEISEGKFCFVPGKIVNGGFMAGQTIDGIFVPGLTVKTPAKISLIPGCVMKEEGFIAGINKELKFVPGQIFKDGIKEVFVPAEQVVTDDGIKYVHREEPPPGATIIPTKASTEPEKQKNGNGEVATNGTASKKEKAKKEKKMKKVKGLLKDNDTVYGHMIQMEKGVEFYPEGHNLPTDNVLRTIPGQLVKHLEEEEPRFVPGMMMEGKFVAGQMVRTAEGTKFVPGQLVRNKEGAKFVPGQTLEDGQFVPGQVVDNKFVPGQIVQTTAGPTFIPGQVIATPEEGARFVPGRVVETFEGPHFVPGRVIEDQNGAVAFVPGRVVETEDGPRFVAPDLESTPDGTPKFAMQSFEVSPEELQLLEHQGTTNMESGGTIDQQMLEHLAKAGITLSQKSLPDVYVTPKNLQEMANHISGRLKLPEEAKIKISMVLDKVAELGHNIKHGKDSAKEGVVEHERPKLEISSVVQNHAFEIIESAILAAVLTASKDISMNPGEAIVQEMNIVLEEALPSNSLSNSSYTDYLVTALFEVVTSEATLEAITTSVQQGLKKPVANKVEVLKYIANRTANVQDTVEKISSVLRKPKHHPDLGKAFRRLSIGDPDLVDLVVAKVSNKVENVNTEKEAANTLQTAIVSAVRENSERHIHEILDNQDPSGLRHLILQAVGLAEALGLKEAADELMFLLEDDRIANALSKDRAALEILQRLTLMKKLAESRPAYAQAMSVLSGQVPKEDTKFLKQLVRESEALLTSVQEEEDSYEDDDDTYSTCSFNSAFDDEIISRVPRRINSSKDIPYSLFHAFVDCQKPLKLLKRILLAAQPDRRFAYDHSCVILKDRNQTVIPKESSRDVLTGRASYTLIDEAGVKNYNALDVFSALKIDKPIALKKFSLYTEGLASTWVHAAELPPEMNDLITDSSYTPVAYEPVSSPVQDSTFEESSLTSEAFDVYVAICDYEAADENEISVKAGDLVEILDYCDYNPTAKKARLDDEGLESAGLLDTSAARHKMAIRPKRNPSSRQKAAEASAAAATTTISSSSTSTSSEVRWIAKKRITGGVGFLPHSVLKRDGEPDGECEDPLGMRNAIIAELIATEKELGNDLNYVVEKYINPSVLDPNAPDCVKENRDLIFGNFKKIAEFHNSVFYEGIKFYTTEPKMIGKAICRLERDFDMHVEYCQNEPAAQEFLEDDDEASEYFADLSNKLGDSKTLSEHLKLPIQRINDYQLLLKELVKYQQILKEPTKDCERALDFMYGVPTKANDLKFINSIEGYKGSIQKLGRLLAHEWFTITDAKNCTKERYCFLFKSRILVCKVKRISDDRSIFILKDIHKLPDCEIVDNEEDPLTFQLVHKNPFTHTRYPITFKAHGPQSKQAWVECIQEFKEDSVALQEHFVDDLKVDGLADGETAEEETSTQKLYKKILAEQEKEKKKAEARKAFDEATKPKPKPRAKSKTPQPEEVAAAATGAEGEAAAPVVYINPDGTPAEPGTPGAVPAPSNLGADQLPTDFRVPTPDEQANMSETVTVTYPQPASEVPVAGVGAGGDEKPDLSLNVNLAINESRPSTPSSAPQTPLREPNRPRFTKTIDPWACEPGQSTAFECTLFPSTFPATVTWLKDNKPLDDQLADRVTIVAEENNTRFRLSMLHCRVEDTGTYTARASNQDCSATCSAYLLVQEMTPEEKEKRAAELGAQIMVRFKDTEVLEETYLRFLVQVKGDPAPVIKFFKDDLLITPDNNRVKIVDEKAANGYYELVVPYVGPGDAGRYTCSVMNKFGEDKCDAVVKVVPEKDVFKGLADGPPGEKADFKWLRDGKPFDPEERFKVQFRDDEDSLALIFQHVKPEDAGLYTCVASTSSGKISCSAELTVEGSITQLHREPEKPCITTENMVAHANVGSSAMLELKVAGFPKPQITWTHEGKPIEHGGRFRFLHEDDETLALVIKHVEADDSGMYKLVAKNELGESTMDIELSVKAPPKFRFKMEDRKALSEETLVMEVDIEASPVPVVKWFKDGKELFVNERISFEKDGSKYKMTILKANMDDSGTYSVCATNEVSQATEYWNLAVSQPPKFIKGLVKSMECKEQENVSLDVKIQCKPAPQVKWYICKPSATSQTKEYKVDEEKQELVADGRHVIMSMDGENYSLKLTGLTRVDSGFYRCIATNNFGQSTQDCEINVKCAPQLSQKLADTKLTEGDSNVVLSVAVNSYPEPKVTWYINDSEITESRTAFVQSSTYGVYNLTLKDVSTDMTGKYTCKIANELGTTETSASYSVHSKPKFTKPLEEKNDVDEAQTLNLSVTVQANPAPQVKWYKNGNEVSADARIKITKEGTETYNLTVTLLKLEDTGDYEVKATNEQGTSSSVTKVTVSKTSTQEATEEEKTNDENDIILQEAVQVTAAKPIKPRRSMSEMGPQQAKASEGLRKHSLDQVSGTAEEAQHEKADKVPTSKKADPGFQETSEDEKMEELLRRVQRNRSILDEIIEQEDARNKEAFPTILSHTMNDTKVYESLSHSFEVHADGLPRPEAKWFKDGKAIKSDDRIVITSEEKVYKLEITEIFMEDAGLYKCTVSNRLGDKSQETNFGTISVNEFRKPTVNADLKPVVINKNENGTLTLMLVADPVPDIVWYHNGKEIATDDLDYEMTLETKDIENNLKECYYSLTVNKALHGHTGEYKIFAKNKYGEMETATRLDVQLLPEISELKDFTINPYENTQFEVVINSNPKPKVTWYQNEEVISNTDHTQLIADIDAEIYRLAVSNITLVDAGTYKVVASNSLGEASRECKLTVHNEAPQFVKPIEQQTVKAYGDVDFRVRYTAVPTASIKWYFEGKELVSEGRYKIEVNDEHGTASLQIEKLEESDIGVYSVTASNLAGQAECSAQLQMAQTPPSFINYMDKYHEIDEGETLTIKMKVDGSPIPTVKWYKDGDEIKDDNRVKLVSHPDGSIELLIAKVVPGDCGAYKIVAANKNGERAVLSAVAVNPSNRKPVFIKPLADIVGKADDILKLEAQIMAFPAPEVHWFKDGYPVRPHHNINFINSPGGIIGIHFDKVTLHDAGKYSCTISNRLGELEATAVVEVEAAARKPVFQDALQPTSVVEGYPAKLEVKLYGHPKPVLTWTHRGEDIVVDGKRYKEVTDASGITSLIIDKVMPEDAGEYAVTANNDLGFATCKNRLEVTLKEKDNMPEEVPAFIHPLRDAHCEEGGHLTLDVPFLGNPIPEVVWSKNGQPIAPGDKTTITCDGRRVGLDIRPMTLADVGKYDCTLTNRLGKASTNCNVAVRKVFQAPTFTQTFGDLQQLPNYDAKFLCRINGLPAPDVVWTKEGKVLPGRDTDKYQVKRDGDACLLYIRNCTPEDNGKFSCTAKNSAGENTCTAGLEIVEKIGKRQKAEAPIFLKKLGDCVVYQGMTARFTACVTGCPEPELEWYRDTTRLFNSERVKFEKETSGLVRLIIEKVGEADMAIYRLRATNEHGQADCEAKLVYDTLEERADKKTMSDQYSEYDKIRKSGAPLPLADRPIVSRMTDRNLTLSWKPSIPKGPREPVNYRVEMCELPGGDWFDIRSGIKSCACDIRNLEPYRDYKFRVRVENRYGISDPSPYAITYREKLEPDPPKFIPYLEPNLDFRPETSPFFPKDFDIEKPHIDGFAKAPKFLRQEDYNNQYGVMDHNCQLEWFVYGYPKPKVTYTFNDQPVEMGGRFDCSYTRNGQACLFINKMMSRDCGIYEACAINEHGEARQRVNLAVAEYPRFIKRPEETLILARKSAKIEVRISGTPFPEVKWYKDWLPIAESSRIKLQFIEPDTAVLQIGEAMAKDEGLYSICARNIAGSISTSFSIHVEESEAAYFYSTYTGRIIKEMKPHKNKYIEEFYDLGEELGRGTAGVTYHAVERLSGRNYAAKTMHGKQDLKPFMMNELEIYNQLNHRKLLRLHDVFETKRTLTLVTELASGGELLESLTKQEYVTESEIAGYIRQVLLGLEYMHNQNIAHLGLTPGDILISHPGGDDLKICDFGLSRKIYFTKLASLNYGMPEFVAPEVANGGGVHMATDMWSVGVITYLLLTGVSLFRGKHDRDTLLKVREGKWDDLHLISRNCSDECRDFIKSLLMYQMDNRMDVHTALKHPWLLRADKLPQDEPHLSTDALRHYYQGLRDWYSNASCRTWYRRKPLDGADTHPSCMVYPPGVTYTPPASPKATPERALWENKIESRGGVDYELGLIKNESHYQYGPDTYLLQLRDVDFPCRLREYMKVAANRSAAFALNDQRDWRAPVIRERRRFTDVMDEEIDDERKDRIAKYGSADTYTLRRLRHELGTRMEGQFEAEAMVESKRDGQPPFMREKPQMLPILEDKPAKLSCLAVGDPKPVVQWFKNDNLVPEGKRVTITEDSQGRSILSFDPALPNDAGIYKVVARNRVGQTVARVRVVLAGPPSAPDSPEVAEKSDTEIFLKWKQPKDDGNSIVLCYSLQYKEADKVEWVDCASGNIDHEFFLVRNLCPKLEYQFRLAARNHIGWSDKGVPSAIVKTRDVGCPKVTSISKAMLHLQQLTESGQKVQGLEEVEEEIAPIMDYSVERSPLTWRDENPSEKFNFISEISRGRFSVVAKAIERATDKVIVAKVLGWTPESELDVLREFEAWHSLRHERICLLNEAYRVGSAATLILEKLQGSDVLTYLASRHEYSEQMVVSITQQVLDGLQYLHWRGICHLAIEPDNVVMAGIRSAQVKLVDFGSAQRVSKLGTGVPRSFATEFSAPEILNNEPAFPQSDVWSVGVLTYVLLSGVSPYRAESVEETKANITYVRYRFEHLYKELTGEATRFLMFLFKRTPCKRPTAEECMEHRWLLPTDHLVKKRERAVFLGNRLKEFSEVYHGEKTRAAAAMEEKKPKAIPMEVKLARSVSVQEELQTPN